MSCITEILKLKGDKEFFVPVGNWVAVEGGGIYKDHEYLIVLNPYAHRCGYVALKPEHPYSQPPEEKREFLGSHWNYNNLDIDVHGGLTFMDHDHGLKELLKIPCHDIWIGFDCGHSGDASDIPAFIKYYGEEEYKEKESHFKAMRNLTEYQTIKNYQYVEEECFGVINQLIKISIKYLK